jgi:AcrR family transcriptional regulator
MTDRSESPDRQRGRPRRDRQGKIPEELVRSLRHVLAHKPAHEITVREIAAVAGTSPEMVRYYFNGKDGLITALLDESLMRVQSRLDELKRSVGEATAGHSRLIVSCLAALYLEERAAGKLFNSEFAGAHSQPMELARRSGTIVEAMCQILVGLVERDIYRPTLDPVRAAILIMSLTGCPVRLLDTLAPRWLDEDQLRDPIWIDDMACMVDACCLA